MAEYLIQDTTLDAIADAINAKTGGSSAMTPAQMVTAIGSIPSGGGGGGITATLVGETPVMSTSNNSNSENLCTFDVDGVSFDAILFISKDRAAFKLISYFEDTIAFTQFGMMIYGNYYATQGTSSFAIASRTNASEKTIVVSHNRMTSTSGKFYINYPQKFDIYAVVLNPPSWVPGVS